MPRSPKGRAAARGLDARLSLQHAFMPAGDASLKTAQVNQMLIDSNHGIYRDIGETEMPQCGSPPASQGRATVRHETARIHHPPRRRGARMAARGAGRSIEGSSMDRLPSYGGCATSHQSLSGQAPMPVSNGFGSRNFGIIAHSITVGSMPLARSAARASSTV